MTLHQKPTSEELDAAINQSLQEAEATEQPKPAEQPPEPQEPQESEKQEPQEEQPEVKQVVKEVQEEEPPQEELKKKLTNSAREAQVLQARTKKYDEAVQQAESIGEPTDDEMSKTYGKSEWEELPEIQKSIAKQAWVSNKRFEIMSQAAKEGKDVEAWNIKVDQFVTDPKVLIDHPELEGKQDDFKYFASKPTRRGLDFEDLVLAFTGDLAKNKALKPTNKGKMFETGSPGQNDKQGPRDGKISMSQAEVLKKSDYKKYVEYLKSDKIRFDIE